jgi:hypothetical protein
MRVVCPASFIGAAQGRRCCGKSKRLLLSVAFVGTALLCGSSARELTRVVPMFDVMGGEGIASLQKKSHTLHVWKLCRVQCLTRTRGSPRMRSHR